MAQATTLEPGIKYNLRQRSPSQVGLLTNNVDHGENENDATELDTNLTRDTLDKSKGVEDNNQNKRKKVEGSIPEEGLLVQLSYLAAKDVQFMDKTGKQLAEIPVIDMAFFKEVEATHKLDLLMAAINKINTSFHYKFQALSNVVTNLDATIKKVSPKIDAIESSIEVLEGRIDEQEANGAKIDGAITRINDLENTTIKKLEERVAALESSMTTTKDDVFTLKGFSQVQDKQVKQNKAKILDLTQRSMSNNVLIHGITPDPNSREEDCKSVVVNFLQNKLQMEIKEEEIIVAHRMGKKISAKPRTMVVRCDQGLRNRIFNYTKNLKDLKNDSDDPYFNNPQLPEPLASEKRQGDDRLWSIRRQNAKIPEEQKDTRVKAEIHNRVLYVNNVPQITHIHPPTVQDIFEIDQKQQQKIDSIQYVYTEPQGEKNSSFCAIAMRVTSAAEVRLGYKKQGNCFQKLTIYY